MENENRQLDELAGAIIEGIPVDWASAESSSSGAECEVVRQLKIVAGIAALHRGISCDIPPARLATELPGEQVKRWGRLNLIERIGRGSFGEVYRAWDTKLDRQVALKLLHARDSQAGAAASRILAEARLLARVRHPNVVTVFDADEIDGCVGLWMEFIDGHNLEEILREKKSLEVSEVARIALDLCRALDAVHKAGLIHRDIKCQNLMRADDGRLVLMDFGTGRELSEQTESAIDAAGTPLYLAPEIFRGQPATTRSDLYSAGVVLFHLLTGTYPVLGATATDLSESHARGDRIDRETALRNVDRSIASVIHRALQIDPAKRFESAHEMLAALEKARPDAEERRRVRHRLVLAAAVAVAVPLVVAAGLIYRGSPRNPQSTGGGAHIGSTPEMRAVQTPNAMLLGLPSPDGRFLPFSEMRTGNLGLYEFATGQNRMLTQSGDLEHSYAEESIVSEDNTRIAFNWNEAGCDCTQLRVIDAAGGNEQILYGAKEPKDILPLAWSSDGQRILGTRRGQEGETEIVWVSVPSGEVRVVKTLSQQPLGISLSPDDRYIAYGLVGPSHGINSDIYVLAADASWEHTLVTGPTDDSHPMWTGDGSGFLFASKRTGADGLWLQNIRDGTPEGQPQLVNKDVGRFKPITLTRRGALFYDLRTGVFDVYTAPIEPDTGVVVGEPINGAASFLGSNISPDWSPDSRNLAYASWRSLYGVGPQVLVLRSLESGKERDINLDLGGINQPRWSPDGRFIFARGPDRRGDRRPPADRCQIGEYRPEPARAIRRCSLVWRSGLESGGEICLRNVPQGNMEDQRP